MKKLLIGIAIVGIVVIGFFVWRGKGIRVVNIDVVTPSEYQTGAQWSELRNAHREADVKAIVNAIVNGNMGDNQRTWVCSVGPLPKLPTKMASTGGYNIISCLVNTYLPEMPVDPTTGNFTSFSSYDSGYVISQNTAGTITVSAPAAEGKTIEATMPTL